MNNIIQITFQEHLYLCQVVQKFKRTVHIQTHLAKTMDSEAFLTGSGKS